MINNQYAGKTPEQVWNEWDESQKRHFLTDHKTNSGYGVSSYFLPSEKGSTTNMYGEIIYPISELVTFNYPELSNSLKSIIEKHISEGQYAKGGLTRRKARKILHDKEIRGHALTEKQRKFFGARASGYPYKKWEGGEAYEKGGKITLEEIYKKAGKTHDVDKINKYAKLVWNTKWDHDKKFHFLIDHNLTRYTTKEIYSKQYSDLPEKIKTEIFNHINSPRYSYGGIIGDMHNFLSKRITINQLFEF